MKKLIHLLFLLCCFSCTKNNSDCFNTPCTEEFRTIVVNIKNENGAPIALNSFEVLIVKTKIDITRKVNENEFEMMQESGTYPLFGDEYSRDYQNDEVRINFKGFIHNQEIVNADFTVGADCCHVNLIEGTTEIIID